MTDIEQAKYPLRLLDSEEKQTSGLVDLEPSSMSAAEELECLRRLHARLREEFAAIRSSLKAAQTPRSPLWVLLHKDAARLGEMAALLRLDPEEVEHRLIALVDCGIVVESDDPSHPGRHSYSLDS